MSEHLDFARIEADLLPIFEELRRLEPIFHTKDFGTTAADFERRMAADYFEIGASGRRYSRAFILATVADQVLEDAAAAGWECSDFGLRRLGEDTYQITYTLRQWQRITHRATLWRKNEAGWQVLYHQGTIATGREDDTLPGEDEKPHPPQDWRHTRVRPARVRVRGIG